MENNFYDFEIIFVDDCSHDLSWKVIEKLSETLSNIKGLRMSKNYGQHNALLAGIRRATGEIIVTLDDDLQNPPEEIPKLIKELETGKDVVYGCPFQEQHGFIRDFLSKSVKIVLKTTMNIEAAKHISAFRAFRTHLRECFDVHHCPNANIDVLLSWGTTYFSYVEVEHSARTTGSSQYTILKLVKHTFNMITGFSTWPLRISSIIGFFFTIFGFLILVYVLFTFFILKWRENPGFPFLASLIALFSGVQLFTLGIIGEYLARMYFRSMNKPAYHISKSININN